MPGLAEELTTFLIVRRRSEFILCAMAHDAHTNSNDSDPFFDSTASILAFGTNAVDDANSLVSWQRDAFQHDPFAALARDTRRPVEGDANWTDASVNALAPMPANGTIAPFDLAAAVLPPAAPVPHMPYVPHMQAAPLTVGRQPAACPVAPGQLVSQQIAAGVPISSAVPMPSMLSPEFARNVPVPPASPLSPVAQVLTPFALSVGSADPVLTPAPRPSRRRARDLDPLVLAYHRGVKRERRTAAASRLAMYLILVGAAAALYAGYMAFVR
jgi:hypothetical protein